ncbi:HEAT repeat domain-containing protein [Flavobacterium franklandianum]|uniref:HEAT repeat domain-containing protein n=1 Tax=Flavobacterium franklandianum TaxID=2594430 RepID=A0A553CNR0_9FLAO|nr:HEAT repeat domain-containing protein [Flavobacterium franklandianum]TRX22117.1 HEAT repeat domain-containing protein [Flavobacterium franklandianum]TRX28661.1 HEAT repeat domain-containing protein [Flavobacterium franklandianum]
MNENLHILESLKHSSPIIQLIWGLSCLFFIIIAILTFYLKYLRNHLRVNEKIETKYQEIYESYLVTYLYAGNDEEAFSSEQQIIIEKLKKYAADPFKRKIIVSTLLKLRNEISGEMGESIDKLFIKLGLLRYSLAKLRSKKWDVIAIGIRELTQFKIKAVHKIIMNNINHPKREVRKEMQFYLVHLYAFEGLEFLNVLETPLSEWDQIQLLEVLQLNNNTQIADIKPWLKSSNDSVVIFALKIAKVYNQFEAKEVLIELLNHKCEDVRINAISALSHLNIIEAKNILKNNFNDRGHEEQIGFLKMMENVYEASDKTFLMEHINHKSTEIKLLVIEVLKNINFEEFALNEAELKKTLTA